NYGGSGSQNTTTEYTRSYKMNSMLRHNSPYSPARMKEVQYPSNFVAYGDGGAMDYTGPVPSQFENGQFSFEVNDSTQANPALRHNNGACIAFVDGHAERIQLVTITKSLRSPQNNITVLSWQGEYLKNGSPYNPPAGTTSLPAGVT